MYTLFSRVLCFTVAIRHAGYHGLWGGGYFLVSFTPLFTLFTDIGACCKSTSRPGVIFIHSKTSFVCVTCTLLLLRRNMLPW